MLSLFPMIDHHVLRDNLHLWAPVHSHWLDNDRGVAVWLPPTYQNNNGRRYPVLYLQDGMWVLDSDPRNDSLKAGVDSWVEQLSGQGMMREIIIVAIDAVEGRDQEYSPAVRGQLYGQFLIEKIKPLIDRNYRTLPDPETTCVAGWSLGANIALYLIWKRPDIFGMAACLSTCFFDCPTNDDSEMTLQTFEEVIQARDFNPRLRIYFDYGTDEHLDGDVSQPGTSQTLSLIKNLQENHLLPEINYTFFVEEGGMHRIEDWRRRFYRPLMFLFPSPELSSL